MRNCPRPEREVFGIKLTSSLKRNTLNFDETIRWSTCFWSQQVYWKRSKDNPACCRLINLVMFWVIGKRKWSRRHCKRRKHRQKMSTKALINWQICHWWRRNLRQRILTKILVNWQIWNRHWSKFAGRVYISFRVSLKYLNYGLNLIVGF